jgi:hypothetical protein
MDKIDVYVTRVPEGLRHVESGQMDTGVGPADEAMSGE